MKELTEFINIVENNGFYEGHEILEDKWKELKNIPTTREESYILKGLINGSTALALKVMGKDKPSDQVWATFLKYSPLIDTIDSKYTPLYIEAQKLLHIKYQEFFK